MKNLAIGIAITVSALSVAIAQTKPVDKPAAPAGIASKQNPERLVTGLAWLVGGVWTSDASKFGGGMQRVETRYQWSDNGSFIRFNTHFVTDKADLKTYDGNFFWDPSQKTLSMWYMDAQNAITQGPVTLNGTRLKMLFRSTDFEGRSADLRVDVTRKTNDLYRWELAEKEGDNWKPLAALDYARKP